jgi:hypothetical protein
MKLANRDSLDGVALAHIKIPPHELSWCVREHLQSLDSSARSDSRLSDCYYWPAGKGLPELIRCDFEAQAVHPVIDTILGIDREGLRRAILTYSCGEGDELLQEHLWSELLRTL